MPRTRTTTPIVFSSSARRGADLPGVGILALICRASSTWAVVQAQGRQTAIKLTLISLRPSRGAGRSKGQAACSCHGLALPSLALPFQLGYGINVTQSFQFHPAVAQWFEHKFGTPTAPQELGWPAIQSGAHTLIAAPTGSGKTLAAFLASLDRLFR